MKPSPAVNRRSVRFVGRVQGVGFRYTVQTLAQRYPAVCGYVRNMPDGSVELVIEGDPEDLTSLITAVREAMQHHIRSFSVEDRPATGEFIDFDIRR